MKPLIKTKSDILNGKNSLNILLILFTAIFLMTITQVPVQAQENEKGSDVPTAKMRPNVDYYLAVYFDYKPSKAVEAFKLIEKYFIPVDKEAERYVIQFRPITGPWDEIAFFPLEIGPKALAYSLSPSDAMWNAIFVNQAGSQEQVDEIWKKFQSLVVKTKAELVIRPLVYK